MSYNFHTSSPLQQYPKHVPNPTTSKVNNTNSTIANFSGNPAQTREIKDSEYHLTRVQQLAYRHIPKNIQPPVVIEIADDAMSKTRNSPPVALRPQKHVPNPTTSKVNNTNSTIANFSGNPAQTREIKDSEYHLTRVQQLTYRRIPKNIQPPVVIEIADDSPKNSHNISVLPSKANSKHSLTGLTRTEDSVPTKHNSPMNNAIDRTQSTSNRNPQEKQTRVPEEIQAWPTPLPGFGIENPGTCCYLSSVIQALRFVNIERNFLPCEQNSIPQESYEKAIRTRATLHKITHSLNSRTITAKEILEFLRCLRENNVLRTDWGDGQEDAIELCQFLLEGLYTKKIQFSLSDPTKRRAIETPHIPSYIPVGNTMQDSIQQGNLIFKKNSLPDVLPIHLKRYIYTHTHGLQKLHPVALTPYISIPLEGNETAMYQLISVVVHRTQAGPNTGHYYTYVAQTDTRFVCYNDSSVTQAPQAVADINQNGCLYLYRRILDNTSNTSAPIQSPRVHVTVATSDNSIRGASLQEIITTPSIQNEANSMLSRRALHTEPNMHVHIRAAQTSTISEGKQPLATTCKMQKQQEQKKSLHTSARVNITPATTATPIVHQMTHPIPRFHKKAAVIAHKPCTVHNTIHKV